MFTLKLIFLCPFDGSLAGLRVHSVLINYMVLWSCGELVSGDAVFCVLVCFDVEFCLSFTMNLYLVDDCCLHSSELRWHACFVPLFVVGCV